MNDPPYGRQRVFAVLCIVLLFACLAALTRSLGQRRRAASIASHFGLAQRQPAVLETARVMESDADAAALIAGALLDEQEGAVTGKAGTGIEGVKGLLLEAIVRRPGAAHYRLLLGRSASAGSSGLWEVPLKLAARAAPGLDAAPEALAGRYLALWPALSPDRRSGAATALKRAFLDLSFVRSRFTAAVTALGPESAVRLLSDDPAVLGAALELSEENGGGPGSELLKERLKALRKRGDASTTSRPGS